MAKAARRGRIPTVKEIKHAAFTFGRMNPPSLGHQKLIRTVSTYNVVKEEEFGDWYVFLSKSHDNKRNPIKIEDRYKLITQIMKSEIQDIKSHVIHSATGHSINNPIDIVKYLSEGLGYQRMTLIVGEDRVETMKVLLNKYNNKEYKVKELNVVSCGDRDEDSDDIEGISGTKLREYAKADNFKMFSKGVDSRYADKIFALTKKGLKDVKS